MSLTTEPDYQIIIDRLVLICEKSSLLFPLSIGGDNTKQDLVTQIIPNRLPIPTIPVDGPDPPYIFISQSEVPIISQEQRGRDSLDKQGGKRVTLEFYMVIFAAGRDRQESEKQVFAIIQALTEELSNNKRLAIPSTPPLLSPVANTHKFTVVPYLYDITQNQKVAKNVVIRPVLSVNQR